MIGIVILGKRYDVVAICNSDVKERADTFDWPADGREINHGLGWSKHIVSRMGEHGVLRIGEHGVVRMGEHGELRMGENGVLRMGEHGILRMGEHGVLRMGEHGVPKIE